MSRVVKKNLKMLRALALMKPKEIKEVLKAADKGLIHSVCECAHNLLRGNVKIDSYKKRKLSKYKSILRRLVKKGESVKIKKKYLVQKGGGVLIPLLLSAVLQTILQ